MICICIPYILQLNIREKILLYYLNLIFFFYFERVILPRSGWSRTCLDQADVKLTDICLPHPLCVNTKGMSHHAWHKFNTF